MAGGRASRDFDDPCRPRLPVGSSTQVTPPPSFFRPNEFDTGAFGTFVTGLGSGANAGKHAWGEAWIPLIGSPGNMQVSGSKGQHQLAVEVAEALWRRDSALSSLAADCRGKGASSVKTSPFLFLGGSRGTFSLKAGPKKETATRASCPQEEAAKREGGREPSLPSPLGAFAVGRAPTSLKKMQLSNGVTTL